jgi:hypothetical protein
MSNISTTNALQYAMVWNITINRKKDRGGKQSESMSAYKRRLSYFQIMETIFTNMKKREVGGSFDVVNDVSCKCVNLRSDFFCILGYTEMIRSEKL